MCKIYRLIIFLLYLFPFSSSHAQTIEGTSGLFFIPTADMQTDMQFTVGASFIDKSLISFSGYERNAVIPFFSFNYLPFFEISGRITRLINPNHDNQGIGDRTISLRVRFLSESDYYPSVLVGLHDLAGVYGGSQAVRNNALYLVLSKHVNLNEMNNLSLGFHAGYGSDRIPAQHHNFVGLFGGISLKIFQNIELMSEYDGTHSNGGIRIKLFNHISLLGGLLRYKYFSGGASVYWLL